MKGDFSRRTFQANKRYSSVRMQQGRVQLDADWNEQVEIQQQFSRTQNVDIIGQSGVPREAPDSFRIVPKEGDGRSLVVTPGRIYVDGILCELDKEIVLRPEDFPQKFRDQLTGSPLTNQGPKTTDGVTQTLGQSGPNFNIAALVYVEVWERLITAVEDPTIAEVALGGPDTAARTQIIAQVKIHAFTKDSPNRTFEDEAQSITPNGRFDDLAPLKVTVKDDDPPSGNQLYRIEIHDAAKDDGSGATFKWSRDNGSIVAEWVQGTGVIEVNGLGRVQFAQDQIIELLDEAHELQGIPGELRRIVSVKAAGPGKQELTLESAPTGTYTAGKKVRAWNSVALPIGTKVELPGGGLLVDFPVAQYRSGDAWLVTVRQGNTPTIAEPAESKRHFARLAVLTITGQSFPNISDLRTHFESLRTLSGGGVIRSSGGSRVRNYHQRAVFNGRINALDPIYIRLRFEDPEHVPNQIKMALFVGRIEGGPGSFEVISDVGGIEQVSRFLVNHQDLTSRLSSVPVVTVVQAERLLDITSLVPRTVGVQEITISFQNIFDPRFIVMCDIYCE